MNKYNILAGSSLLTGIVMFVFGQIASFMGRESDMTNISIKTLLGEDHLNWIKSIPLLFLKSKADTFVNAPIYIILIGAGIIIFILNGIFRKD